jgi:hypothetical protein
MSDESIEEVTSLQFKGLNERELALLKAIIAGCADDDSAATTSFYEPVQNMVFIQLERGVMVQYIY